MELSVRNQLKAKVKNVKSNDVSSEVVLDVGGQEMCAVITTGSVKRLGLKVGDDVFALVKATSVMIMK
ncbi:TOBE domain protein [Desulfofarcimen acetoxidans DSM 771]|uniref:TOBE domain protein n=1 Tax=Desulfofarcimen acetoxidans (strain ATCC 49208 / DSM 771 / KCTC 5769 / VKM B-1644 / 5575) TaxID=485916 RepID=C8W6Q6_DESAS|nr:TOBE domain-containing protein [Desulfofarcimen acetoxidans]ACV64165.1 TOBE domain protein [Desulfofarcimen acetoxidans DSM 771]